MKRALLLCAVLFGSVLGPLPSNAASSQECHKTSDGTISCKDTYIPPAPTPGAPTHSSPAPPSPIEIQWIPYAFDDEYYAYILMQLDPANRAIAAACKAPEAEGFYISNVILITDTPDYYAREVQSTSVGCYGAGNPQPQRRDVLNTQTMQDTASTTASSPSVVFSPTTNALVGLPINVKDATPYGVIQTAASVPPCFAAAAAVPIGGYLHVRDLKTGVTAEYSYDPLKSNDVSFPAFNHRGQFALWLEVTWTARYNIGCTGAPTAPDPLGTAGYSLGQFSKVSPITTIAVSEVKSVLK